MRLAIALGAAVLAAALPAFGAAEPERHVPFVPTPDDVAVRMLELAKVGPADHVMDLGSGDGRIVITAAKRFGASGTGFEIIPHLVRQSRERARREGVEGKVKFLEQDLFKADLDPATVITLYLFPDVNLKLRPSLLALKPGTRIVSHDFDMGDWKPDRTLTIRGPGKKPGSTRTRNLYLWVVPADVDALWCGEGNATGTRMTIAQQYQRGTATLSNVRGVYHFEAAVDAHRVTSLSGDGRIAFVEEKDMLHVREAAGPFAHLQGTSFSKSCCGSCAY